MQALIHTCQLISSRNCNTGKSKLMTRSLNGFTTRPWVDLIIIISSNTSYDIAYYILITYLITYMIPNYIHYAYIGYYYILFITYMLITFLLHTLIHTLLHSLCILILVLVSPCARPKRDRPKRDQIRPGSHPTDAVKG
jgi:hypothetical protein